MDTLLGKNKRVQKPSYWETISYWIEWLYFIYLTYFKNNGLLGKIDPLIQKEIWQVFTKTKNSKSTNAIYLKVVNPNSKFSEFCLYN